MSSLTGLSKECQKKYEELQQKTPNLNKSVFHSKCGTQHMMGVQKASEIKYGSNITFLETVLKTARTHNVHRGIAADLGSGTGVWTKHLLAKRNWQVHAVDLYKPSLDDLERSVSLRTKKRLTVHNTDFRNLSLPEKVDLAIANNSLCFVPRSDLEAVLDAIYDSLKPGGIFAATFFGNKDIRGTDPHLSTFTAEEIRNTLRGKYTILSCCKSVSGTARNLDRENVTWHVIEAIVQKPAAPLALNTTHVVKKESA